MNRGGGRGRGGGGFRGRGGRGGGRGGGGGGGFGSGGGGFGRFGDQGPPEQVVELGYFAHPCEDQLVVKCTLDKVPYFNAPIFLENKQQIGKVDEIFGPIRDYFVSVTMTEEVKAASFSTSQKFFIDPYKLLPLDRFLPKAPGSAARGSRGRGGIRGRGGDRARGGGGRGFRGGGRGGSNSRGGGGRGGSFRGGGGSRGGFNSRGGGSGFSRGPPAKRARF